MQFAHEVVGEQLINGEDSLKDALNKFVGNICLNQLLYVIQIRLEQRFTQKHPGLLGQRGMLLIGQQRLTVVRIEGHSALARREEMNSRTLAERT